jgi:hypothetical protein
VALKQHAPRHGESMRQCPRRRVLQRKMAGEMSAQCSMCGIPSPPVARKEQGCACLGMWAFVGEAPAFCSTHSVAASRRQVCRTHQKLDPCLERRPRSKKQETGRKPENRFQAKLPLSSSSLQLPHTSGLSPPFHPFHLLGVRLFGFLDFKFVPK